MKKSLFLLAFCFLPFSTSTSSANFSDISGHSYQLDIEFFLTCKKRIGLGNTPILPKKKELFLATQTERLAEISK